MKLMRKVNVENRRPNCEAEVTITIDISWLINNQILLHNPRGI